jgi:hypothetical protein
MKKLIPLILILISIALFIFVINPEYSKSKELNEQVDDNEELLEIARELEIRRIELRDTFDSITNREKNRLKKMLPDTIDNVRLIFDIDNIAKGKGVSLSNFKVEDKSEENTSDGVVVSSNARGAGVITLSFNMQASYPRFKEFMDSLERSLRVVDVKRVILNSGTGGTIYDFTIELDTYWLR